MFNALGILSIRATFGRLSFASVTNRADALALRQVARELGGIPQRVNNPRYVSILWPRSIDAQTFVYIIREERQAQTQRRRDAARSSKRHVAHAESVRNG